MERTFKGNPPAYGEDPALTLGYWQRHMDTYGTPTSHMSVRAMFYHLKGMHSVLTQEINRQTEIIVTLRQELREAKARNTMYLSRIQEYEAREQ